MKLSKNFHSEEFDCRCGCKMTGELMSPDFIDSLQQLRSRCEEEYGGDFPFIISSGIRCKIHNRAVGGKDRSFHLGGRAADIRLNCPIKRHVVVRNALDMGFTVIIYDNFLHLDNRRSSPLLLLG